MYKKTLSSRPCPLGLHSFIGRRQPQTTPTANDERHRVRHALLADRHECGGQAELGAERRRRQEEAAESCGTRPVRPPPAITLLARGRNRLRAASGLGEPRPVGKCVFVAGPLASHVEQGPYGRRPQPAPPPPASAQGRLALRSASVSLGQLAGVLCCGPRRPCFLHRLESRCGTAPQHQHLTLLDPSGKVIASHPHPHTRTHTHTHALTSSHLTPHTHALAPTLTPSHPGDRVTRRRRCDAERHRHHRRPHAARNIGLG